VLIDLLLPDGRGEELGQRIDAMNHGAALLYMSGCMDPDLEGERAATDHAFIEKPFTFGSLAEKVRLLLGPAT